MYLRHTTVRKNGKSHCYWRLVRSVRIGRKVRQETVACLGELDAKGRARCAVLICLDLRYPEPFRYLKAKGVRAVFMPFYVVGKTSRWKLPVLEGTLRCRAAENGFYLIGSNVAGPDHAMLSRACDPNGCSIGEAKLDRESLFVATLDLSVTSNFLYPGRRTDLFEMRAKKSL